MIVDGLIFRVKYALKYIACALNDFEAFLGISCWEFFLETPFELPISWYRVYGTY